MFCHSARIAPSYNGILREHASFSHLYSKLHHSQGTVEADIDILSHVPIGHHTPPHPRYFKFVTLNLPQNKSKALRPICSRLSSYYTVFGVVEHLAGLPCPESRLVYHLLQARRLLSFC